MSVKSFQQWMREQDKLPRYTRPDLEERDRKQEEELKRQEEIKRSEGWYTGLDRNLGGLLPGGIPGGPSMSGVGNWIDRAGQTGGEIMTGVDNPAKATTGNKVGDVSADIWGGIMGFAPSMVTNPGGIVSTGGKLFSAGEKAIEKGLSLIPAAERLPGIARTGIKMGGATVPYELGMAAANDREIRPGEALEAGVANAALGAALHGAGSYLGMRGAKTEPAQAGEVTKPIPEDANFARSEPEGMQGVKTMSEDIGLKPEQGQSIPTPGQAGYYDPGTIGAARLTIPEKMQSIGEGQKVRSFNVSTTRSEMASPDVKIANIMEMYPGGLGAYTPVKLREVDVEAQKLISQDIEKATRLVLDGSEPSALKTATGIRLIEKYQNANNYERAIDISLAMAERLTRAGQEISAARIMGALKPDGVLVFAQRRIKKLNQGKKFGKDLELSPDTAKNLEDLAKRMQNAADENARLEAGQELQGALNALKPSGILRKIDTTQTISQLLNPKTIVRNVVGNEMFYRLERLNKIVATPIDWTISKLTGVDRQVTFRTAGQGGYWQGFFKGAKAGWKGVNPDGIQTQYDLGRAPAFDQNGNFAEKTMSFLERTLGATLKSFDFAAYTRAKNQTLGELATLRAINTAGKADRATVQEVMQNMETNLLDIADQYGKYVTFQDNNVISKVLQGAKDVLNAKQDWGAGSVIIKYPRTPGALIARGLEYSPAGFLKSAYEIAKVFASKKGWMKNSNPSQREATLALSRAITGTAGLTGLGYFLAEQGIITGSMEKDRDLRELQRQVGEGQYRVNLSALSRWVQSGFDKNAAQPMTGDKIINYDWMQPIAMALSMGVNIAKNIQEGQGKLENTSSTAASSLEGALNTVADQPVLQGLTRFMQGYDMGSNVTNTLKGIPASFMPTLGNQIRTYSDNTVRSTYDPSWAKEAVNKAKVKIPGVASDLPVAYDSFGKPRETYRDDGNSFFNVFLNPAFTAKYKVPEEARLAIDTFRNSGETKQIPRVIAKYFTVSGKKIQLTADEYSEMQRIVGEETQKGFAKIPQSSRDEIKIRKMIDILTDAGMEGKKYILKQRGIAFRKKGNGIKLTGDKLAGTNNIMS